MTEDDTFDTLRRCPVSEISGYMRIYNHGGYTWQELEKIMVSKGWSWVDYDRYMDKLFGIKR
jgi:hypothetical protein